MPSLLAAAAASVAGWAIAAATQSIAGTAGALLASFVLSSVVFVVARRFFAELRGNR